MLVCCKCEACAYCKNGICYIPTLSINEMGACGWRYMIINNQMVERPNAMEPLEWDIEEIPIIDIEEKGEKDESRGMERDLPEDGSPRQDEVASKED